MTPDIQHIFADHLLQPLNNVPVQRVSSDEVWPSVFLILCLCLLAYIKLRAYPKVVRIVQSTFSHQILQQLEREEINPFRFYAVGLNLFFIFNVSFLVYKINSLFGFVLQSWPHLWQYLFFVSLVAGIFLSKVVANTVLSVFTGQRQAIADYNTNSTLVNQTFGLFLFPFVILMQFSNFPALVFAIMGIIVLAVGMCVKWYRGLMQGLLQERIGLLQIFSYFCGLEILPVLVLVKYIIETF